MTHITAFYQFKEMTRERAQEIAERLNAFSKTMRGLVLLGTEGVNGTVSGSEETIQEFKRVIQEEMALPMEFKDSTADRHPFRALRIKLKKEIVTLGRPDLVPQGPSNHLSPKEWHEVLSKEEVVVIDTRNTYETDIGKFKNAIDPRIEEFSAFPEKIKEMGLQKDQKILIYCTGGIRCEKAILGMNEQGYKNVYQLKGGILEYLKEFPNQHFDGECFVFDHRVAVDQNLNPSENYRLCPHCGQPATEKIDCVRCGTKAVVCKSCLEKSHVYSTCSKNCAHHERIQSRSKKPHKDALVNRTPVT